MIPVYPRRVPRWWSATVMAVVCALWTWPAQAQIPAQACPGEPELLLQAQQKFSSLTDTRARLADFVSGKKLTDVPPAALFTVDLSREEAISRRINELQRPVGVADVTLQAWLDHIHACAGGSVALDKVMADIVAEQAHINRLRLEFLSLSRERRETLLNVQRSLQQHTESVSVLEQEHSAAAQVQQQALISLAAAEEQARTAENADLRELATHKAYLEKTRQELANINLSLTSGLTDRTKTYQATAKQLSILAGQMTRDLSHQDTWKAYLEVAEIWRQLVDKIFERIADPAGYETLPTLPERPASLLEKLGTAPPAQEYQQAYSEIENQYHMLEQLRSTRFSAERDNLYMLLLQAGRLRSQLIGSVIAKGDEWSLMVVQDFFSDIGREIRIVPYQLLAATYEKILDFKQKAGSGLQGWVEIITQIFQFIIFLAIPFLVYRLLKYLSHYLDHLRRGLIRGKIHFRYAKAAAIWIQRLNAYVPWVVMLIGVEVATGLVAETGFSAISLVLLYISYYFWYQIFLLLVSSLVSLVAYSGALETVSLQKERINKSAKDIVLFFILALAVLHATQDVVGKALVYHLIYNIMLYVGTFVCAFEAYRWRNEIALSAEQVLPAQFAGRIKHYCLGRASLLVCLPTLFLVVAAIALEHLKTWASGFDIFKRFGAELFRRRIESATSREPAKSAAGDIPAMLPEDYTKWFDIYKSADTDLLISPHTGIVDDITKIINAWLANPNSERSLALYGDKGSGKSSLLEMISNTFSSCQVRKLVVPPKLHDRASVLAFFSQALGLRLQNGVLEWTNPAAQDQMTIILVDDAHNMFLSTLGGFEGYRAFKELINAPMRNLFWCAAFNRQSWNYLRGVFGGDLYFRKALLIPPLTDVDIHDLIITRHAHAKYQLVFDQIIRAAQTEDDRLEISRVEIQFFRLLWRQSRGNPRAAIILWLNSLRPHSGGRLWVGMPVYPTIKELEGAGDDAWFVYAAMLRHENISIDEAAMTTNLPEGNVFNAFKIGVEHRVIELGKDQRYRVAPYAQFYLSQMLSGKNFIYE